MNGAIAALSCSGSRAGREFLRRAGGTPATTAQVRVPWSEIKDFPVQFLAARGLTEEAVRKAAPIEYEGVPAKVFSPEYIIAIAARVGRHKDLARIEQPMSQTTVDEALLDDILRRYNLKLPNR